ncbi:MAG: radical SAM protein [Candidatus Lokiarchaeota archaeon]|nr:radical SAM protein [Candidatus Harpocratesius repetitus]
MLGSLPLVPISKGKIKSRGKVLNSKLLNNQNPFKIKRLILELSRNCNLNCSMCGFGGNPIREDWFMNLSIVEKILLDPYIRSNLQEIRLNGRGESTIHPEFISLLKFIRNLYPNVQLTMFTNLMFLDEKIMKELLKRNVLLFISMDSNQKSQFEKIRKKASYELLKRRLKLVKIGFIVFTLQETNWNELLDIGRVAKEHGLGLIINNVHLLNSNARERFRDILNSNWNEILADLLKIRLSFPSDRILIPDQILGYKLPMEIATTISCGSLNFCPNAYSEIMLGYDGKIYPCNMFHPYILGDINTERIEDVIKSTKRQDFLLNHKTTAYCKDCAYLFPKGDF